MDSLSFGPLEIWAHMGLIGRAVFTFLVLMSIYSIWIMVERYIVFNRGRQQSQLFVKIAQPLLVSRDMETLLDETRKYPRSHLAHIFAAALLDWRDYRDNPEPPAGFEDTMARAIEREAVLVTQDLKRGLSGLASIGATAPFVGLFGTVVGIMNAFFSMASAGQGGIGTVAGGIAEALVNTAVGLFVALPAVWGFNYFLNRIERVKVEMTNSGTELVDYFVKHSRSEAWKSAIQNR